MSESKIPRSKEDDYTAEWAKKRLAFLEGETGVKLEHVGQNSFDPARTKGSIEQFTGVAQVPLGIAGPLLVSGDDADGEFFVPLATTEGTLVATYNRGMKLLYACGGIITTVVGDSMQRAPVFVFESGREARRFSEWVEGHFEEIRESAEAATGFGKLKRIERYIANQFVFLRFDFSTGDAAGRNDVNRATYFACEWVRETYPGVKSYFLESNLATDKKAARFNTLMTRGKRVTAEATIPGDLLRDLMRTSPAELAYHYRVANLGGFISGVNHNGLHAANGLTALFIATGQDVANVAESSAGLLYAEQTEDDALYLSLTLPALSVGTHGGGTGLPTQRECLELLGCYGTGKDRKLAEIMAATALAGEISMASVYSSLEWVSTDEVAGRQS